MPGRPSFHIPMCTFATILLGALLALPPVQDATAQETRTVTFDEAMEIAFERNTDIRRAMNATEQRDIDVSSARMNFTPDLSLNTGGDRSFGRTFSQEEGGIVSETTDFFRVGVSGSITLFDGFQRFADLEQANLRSQSSELDLQRTRQDVIFEVMEQFIDVVETQELIQVREEELEVQRRQLEQVREFVETGMQPESDLFQQEAQVAEAEQQLLNAERDAELAKNQLIQTLQLDPFGEYEFEAPALEEADPEAREYDLDRMLRTAFEERADLQAAEFEYRATDQDIRAARSGYYPTISLSGNVNTNWSDQAVRPIEGTESDPEIVTLRPDLFEGRDDPLQLPVPGTGSSPEFEQPDFFDQLNDRRGANISISLSVPLFDRFQTRRNVQRAKVERRNAEFALEDQRQQVAIEVRQAYLDHQNAVKQLEVAQTRLRAAERARDATQERYNLGAATFVELSQANADFVSAASEEVQARFNLLLQEQLVDYFQGQVDPQDPLFNAER